MEFLKSPFQFKSVVELVSYYNNEESCLEYLEQSKWGGKISCAKCGCEKIYRFKDKKRYKCSGCGNHFTAKIGTIFQDSNVPLLKWYIAMYYLIGHKKGISSRQLAAEINVTQKTAWFMQQRIREAFIDSQEKLGKDKVVQIDETFIGGKNKNRHMDKRITISKDRTYSDKSPVLGILEPDGKLRCFVIPDTKLMTIQPLIETNVIQGVVVVTDDWKGYNAVQKEYFHEVVDHSRRKFISECGFSTNKLEGFWTHLKKAIVGIHHRVTKKHLQRYVNESVFRYNFRNEPNHVKLHMAMQNINRPLKYKQLIHEQKAA